MSGDSGGLRFRPIRRIYQQQSTVDQEPSCGLSWIPETTTAEGPVTIIHDTKIEEENAEGESSESSRNVMIQEEGFLGVPTNSSVSTSGSSETLIPTSPMSPSNLSTLTLIGSTGSGCDKNDDAPFESVAVTVSTTSTTIFHGKAPTAPLPERVIPKRPPRTIEQQMAAANSSTLTTTAAKLQSTATIISKSTTSVTLATTPAAVDNKSSTKPPSAPPPVIVEARKHSAASISTTIIVTTPSITAASSAKPTAISPPSLPFDRRPSVGYNVIPHAALCQHRYSLQLNDEVNASKVRRDEIVFPMNN